ncbi:MAG TPA: hypothetical protein PKD61_01895 [Polyangiaceae bacterium]|nr:hypothetical protein [Polyangiaceae bacterium]
MKISTLSALALVVAAVSSSACSSDSTARRPSSTDAGSDASAGAGGTGATGGSAGSSGSGGVSGSAGNSGSGGVSGSGGSSGGAGSGGSGDAGFDAGPVCNVFTFDQDPPKASAFEVTYSDSVGHVDIRLDVQCNGTASVSLKSAGCPANCEWVFSVTGCTPGPATIGFYKDSKGGPGTLVASCNVALK